MAIKFDSRAKELFLADYTKYGLKNRAAKLAGVHPDTVDEHAKGDPEFGDRVKQAYQDYRESLEKAAFERAVEGVETEVFSAGVMVGTKRVFSDRLHELMLKRHIPEFREKSTVDVNHQGGVLVVPGSSADADKWRKEHLNETEEA
jgi:predicted transcriptional regulator